MRDREEQLASAPADNVDHGLEKNDPTLARVTAGGTGATSPPPHSTERSGEHGIRGRAGGSTDVGSGTRPPQHATRYVETRLGTLSYAELAPHLAHNVQALEERIADSEYWSASLNDLPSVTAGAQLHPVSRRKGFLESFNTQPDLPVLGTCSCGTRWPTRGQRQSRGKYTIIPDRDLSRH